LFLILPQFVHPKEIPIKYLSPLPDLKYNIQETGIIIRSDKILDKSIKDKMYCITVSGSF